MWSQKGTKYYVKDLIKENLPIGEPERRCQRLALILNLKISSCVDILSADHFMFSKCNKKAMHGFHASPHVSNNYAFVTLAA